MPSNSTTLTIPADAKSAGVMSVQVRPPSPDVHSDDPNPPSKPMATRPSPPGAITVAPVLDSVSGTSAGSNPTTGGAAGSDGSGVSDGSGPSLGGTDAGGGVVVGDWLGPGSAEQA